MEVLFTTQNNIEQVATFLSSHATMYCYIRVNTNATGTADELILLGKQKKIEEEVLFCVKR